MIHAKASAGDILGLVGLMAYRLGRPAAWL